MRETRVGMFSEVLIVLFISGLILLTGCRLAPPPATELATAPPAQETLAQNPLSAPAPTELSETQPGTPPPATPQVNGQQGPALIDNIYEYNTRHYYYDDKTFGVGGDKDYTGPAPRMTTDKSFTMRVYNIVTKQKPLVDIDINYDTDAREATGLLGAGDSYVTRDGIKIAITKFLPNKFEFTLTKVDPNMHTPLCPECVNNPDVRGDSGVRFVNWREEPLYSFKGKQYTFRVAEIDKRTSSALLKVDTQQLPSLEPGQTYVLRDGNAIKFLFAAAHQFTGYDGYGYAAFGFVDTHELPPQVICPECTDFVYVRDGESQKVLYKNFDHTVALQNNEGNLVLSYDGKDQATLELNTVVKLNNDVSAKLLSNGVVRLIGLFLQGNLETRTTCELSKEKDVFKKGHVRATTGSDESRFDREDFCLDENTLVDYSCEQVPGRKLGSDGYGRTAVMTSVTCACKDGACTTSPT